MARSSTVQIIVIDKNNQKHVAETLTAAEFHDEGTAGAEIIARNYAEENGLQYRNWKMDTLH